MASSATVEIQMPQMGESVTEGTVLEWHKHEGEFVEEGETVVEVSTDKVDAEVPAPASGVITRILKAEDDTIEVGGVLAELDPNGSPSGDGASSDGAGAQAAPAEMERQPGPGMTGKGGGEGDQDLGEGRLPEAMAQTVKDEPIGTSDEVAVIQITMPEMGESVTEGTVLEWHKQEGDSVAEGDTVVEVSTDKVDAEVPAPASGTITKLLVEPDDTVKVGQALAEMVPGEAAEPAATSAPEPAGNVGEAEASGGVIPEDVSGVIQAPSAAGDGEARVSPVARRIAAASGIDLAAVKGSGPGGKVTKADVLAAGDGKGAPAAVPKAAAAGEAKPLRGPAGMLAQAMNESRSMPTATSFRTVPVD